MAYSKGPTFLLLIYGIWRRSGQWGLSVSSDNTHLLSRTWFIFIQAIALRHTVDGHFAWMVTGCQGCFCVSGLEGGRASPITLAILLEERPEYRTLLRLDTILTFICSQMDMSSQFMDIAPLAHDLYQNWVFVSLNPRKSFRALTVQLWRAHRSIHFSSSNFWHGFCSWAGFPLFLAWPSVLVLVLGYAQVRIPRWDRRQWQFRTGKGGQKRCCIHYSLGPCHGDSVISGEVNMNDSVCSEKA